jgi:para-nitrobenzyl esterase
MPLLVFIAAAVASTLFSCATFRPFPGKYDVLGYERVAAKTAQGTVEGFVTGSKTQVFLGIPYARPPRGELRFRPPQELFPWSKSREALAFGPVCPQIKNRLEPAGWLAQDEDCLTINVWTPAADGAKRPVLVWIHGGGFFEGASSRPVYDGESFARRGDIVFVSMNYRVGVLGFLYLDGLDRSLAGSGNLGFQDQIASLKWVKANIAAFGGDPDNVTIMGESAGSFSVTTLMTLPSAKGLFNKVIAESGVPILNRTPGFAARETARFMELAGVDSIEELRALPVENVLKAQERLMNDASIGAERLFMPVLDGAVISRDPMQALMDGAGAGIPLLHGTTEDEFRFWIYVEPLIVLASPDFLLNQAPELKAQLGGSKDRIIEHYKKTRPSLSSGDIAMAIAGDMVFLIPHIRLAEAQAKHAKSYMYLFRWDSPVQDGKYGSHHGLEVPFVFRTIYAENYQEFLGENPPLPLSEKMQDAWIAFVRTGNPGITGLPEWPVYDTTRRATMLLDSEPKLADDPQKDIRLIYKGVLY